MKTVENLLLVGESTKTFVQFGADWCGPCKSMTRYIESEIENSYPEVVFLKVNIDNCSPELLKEHQVRSVPKVVVFDKGIATESFVGFNKQKVVAALSQGS